MLKVMKLRNKYAHNDFSSELNILEPVYFDDDYPLIDGKNNNFIIDSLEVAFHNPTLDTVLSSYEISKKFIEYIDSLILYKYKSYFSEIPKLSAITQNRTTHNYSMIFHPEVQMSIAGVGSDNEGSSS